MVDMVKFRGQKDRPVAENGGKNRGASLLTLKEGVPPPGVTMKMTSPWTAASKTHVRPVNLIYIIMFKSSVR